MSGTASSPTRCGTPLKPATGSSPPASSSTIWRSARSSSRGAARPGRRVRGDAARPSLARAAPHLVSAAVALSAGRPESSMAALDAADGILERLPADQENAARLAAAVIRLTASLRSGDLAAAAAAAARAEMLASRAPGGKLARDPDIRARVLSGRGAVELWSGHLDQAARVLESAVAAASASGGEDEPADCRGHLALAEALRGRLRRAADLAAETTAPSQPAGAAARPAPEPRSARRTGLGAPGTL